MEPISALSLASTLTQLLDFSLKAVAVARQVKNSHEGTTRILLDLDERSEKLTSLCSQLETDHNRSGATNLEGDKSILALSVKCRTQAHELQNLLQSCHKLEPNKAFPVLRTSTKVLWNDRRIKELSDRLRASRDELHFCLTAALYNKLDERSEVRKTQSLQDVRPQVKEEAAFREIKDAIAELSARVNQDCAVFHQESPQQAATNFKKAGQKEAEELLRFLYAPVSRKRQDTIAKVHRETYEWIFRDHHEGQQVTFTQWLEQESGVYWITGKPGCGKSTLIKFICNDERTSKGMGKWGMDKMPIYARFFFWVDASEDARSQLALAKSLLHDILASEPSVLRSIIDSHRETVPYVPIKEKFQTIQTLRQTLQHITSSGLLNRKFCFFVDGLDEFAGPAREICDFVSELGKAENVKLCVTSRPWNEFEAEFGHRPSNILRVNDFTKGDMEKYVHDLLERDTTFVKLKQANKEYQDVVSQIVTKSCGVFLWTFLVTRNLRNNLSHEDCLTKFRQRVDAFPGDLEGYYLRMLDEIPPIYEHQAGVILLTMLRNERPLYLVQLIPMMVDGDDAITQQLNHLSRTEIDEKCRVAWKRLRSHCKDLISLVDEDWLSKTEGCATNCTGNHSSDEVSFFHRTVIDFLRIANIHYRLTTMASDKDDTKVRLLEGVAYHINVLPWTCSQTALLLEESLLRRTPISREKSEPLIPMLFFELMETLCRLAHKIEAKDYPYATRILDVCDISLTSSRVGARDCSLIPTKLSSISGLYEDLLIDLCRSQSFILAFALVCGISWYVEHRVKIWRTAVDSDSQNHRQELDYLLATSSNSIATTFCLSYSTAQFEIIELCISRKTFLAKQSSILRFLLDSGADPNTPVLRGRSSWNIYYQGLFDDNIFTDVSYLTSMRGNITHFLNSGADPTITVLLPPAGGLGKRNLGEVASYYNLLHYEPALDQVWKASYRRWLETSDKRTNGRTSTTDGRTGRRTLIFRNLNKLIHLSRDR